MDLELTDAAAYAPSRRCICAHQLAALLTVKLLYGRHLESVARLAPRQKSDSVNRCVFT